MLFEERLGGEERRLMHLVPAVVARMMTSMLQRIPRNRLAQEIDGVRKEKVLRGNQWNLMPGSLSFLEFHQSSQGLVS